MRNGWRRMVSVLTAVMMALPVLMTGLPALPGGESGIPSAKAEEDPAIPEETPAPDPESTPSSGDKERKVDLTHLRVANPTPLTGHFFTSMWGASTSDLDVQELLHRYKLVVYDNEIGRYRINHLVVSGGVKQDDEEGNRTYYLALYDDLEYSDGTPITSRDYAFTILLMVDPAIEEAGGIPFETDWIKGMDEYLSGESKTLSGLHIIDDYMFSITVKAEKLPYFYELSRLRTSPYPISVIAPGYEVLDDGEGVYLSQPLTGELLKKTILDPETGYMTLPSICSGPYTIDSYENGKAHFLLNYRYKGNQKGEIPTIPELTYGGADGETMLRELKSGELGLLNKVTNAETIQGIHQLIQENPERFHMTTYPRTGLTVLRFMPRSPRTQETPVRQAVYYCMDREGIVRDYTGGFGMPVKGMYGLGQWMNQLLDEQGSYPLYTHEETATEEEAHEYEEELAEWQNMNMSDIRDYQLDVEEAVRLLEENGWTLNREGEAYSEGIRYKRTEDGQLVGLDMKVLIPENMRAVLEANWKPYMEEAGFGLELIGQEIWDLAETYRRDSLDNCDMVIVGENFTDRFRLNGGYHEYEINEGENTPLELLNDYFDELSMEVYHTEKYDLKGFIQKWLQLQIELAESVPVIPIYSNVYFDFFIRELRDYRVEKYLGWGNAIVAAWLGEEGSGQNSVNPNSRTRRPFSNTQNRIEKQ